MPGITVNGVPIESYLRIGQYTDHERERISQIKEATFKRHSKLGAVQQSYDTKPIDGKTFSRGEIMDLNLKEDRERLMAQIEEEAKMDQPVLKKMAIGFMAMGEFISSNQIGEKINKIVSPLKRFNKSSVTAMVSTLVSSKYPIIKLMERQKINGSFHYRLFPSCSKILLSDLAQLARSNGSYTITDALQKVPSVRIEIERGNPILDLKQSESKISESLKEDDDKKILDDSSKVEQIEAPNEKVNQKTDLKMSEIDREVKININVDFGPIRILFGINR